jgi:prevent-host-death family protein
MDIKKINSAKARRSFSDLLNETGFGGHRTVITRKGKAVAAMVPLDDLEAIQVLEDQKDVTEAQCILSDKESEFIPWEQAKKELLS